MSFRIEVVDGVKTAFVEGNDIAIATPQDAMDLIAAVSFDAGCKKLVLEASQLPRDFFVLSTGLAGEVLQKFSNYRLPVAIRGDFTGYTSKPLQDFIRECNREGQQVTFVQTPEAE